MDTLFVNRLSLDLWYLLCPLSPTRSCKFTIVLEEKYVEEHHKIVAFPISELCHKAADILCALPLKYTISVQISKPKLYPQNFIYIAEKQMMGKDENLNQVHKLAAVPEGADKVKVKLIQNPPIFTREMLKVEGYEKSL